METNPLSPNIYTCLNLYVFRSARWELDFARTLAAPTRNFPPLLEQSASSGGVLILPLILMRSIHVEVDVESVEEGSRKPQRERYAYSAKVAHKLEWHQNHILRRDQQDSQFTDPLVRKLLVRHVTSHCLRVQMNAKEVQLPILSSEPILPVKDISNSLQQCPSASLVLTQGSYVTETFK